MRKSPLLDALLPRVRQGLLAATVLRPGKTWYLSELARHLGVRPSTVQRELASLVSAGILKRYRDGNRTYFQADENCPVLAELRGLISKTIGVVTLLEEALRSLRDKIACAFVYGSVARAEEGSESDVDLMIVGEARLSDVAPRLRKLERRLGRPVNPSVYRPEEFARKLASGHHFLSTVMREPRLYIVGDEHVLEDIGKRRRRSTHNRV